MVKRVWTPALRGQLIGWGPGPKKNPVKRHQGRHPHFRFGTMDATTNTEVSESNKRQRLHEAHMIPDLGPRMIGFPNTIITKLRYCDFFVLTGSLGAIANQVFAANGIYDPDVTGVGHQPMWRDTYAGIYNQYVVLGSKITATATCVTADQVSLFVLQGDDDSSNSSALNLRMEQNNSVHRMLGIPGGGHALATLTSTFEPFEMFGVDGKDDGSAQTSVGANPTQLWSYQVALQNADVTTTCKWYLSVEIDYTVKFSELASNGGS